MEWISQDSYLSESESWKNAQNVATYFTGKHGWTKESISALIGNMFHESGVNPGLHEQGYGQSPDRGYGLVQWTPKTKLVNWAKGQNLDYTKGDTQLKRIDWEVENNTQWINRSGQANYGLSNKYNMSFKDFRTNKNKLDVGELTIAFMGNYERPHVTAFHNSQQKRIDKAREALKRLTFKSDSGGDNDGGTSDVVDDILGDVNDFIGNINERLADLLTFDIYDNGSFYQRHNHWLVVTKQMDNMYKVRPTINLGELFKGLIDNVGNIVPPSPSPPNNNDGDGNTDSQPPSSNKKGVVFPIDIRNPQRQAINWWKQSNHARGSLKHTMGFGTPRQTAAGIHMGYDIGAVNGTKVYNVKKGTVRFVGGFGGRTVRVIFDEPIKTSDGIAKGVQYLHLSRYNVKNGQTVNAGDVIGFVGSSGGGAGAITDGTFSPHLHIEFSRNGEFGGSHRYLGNFINPEIILGVDNDMSTTLPNPV